MVKKNANYSVFVKVTARRSSRGLMIKPAEKAIERLKERISIGIYIIDIYIYILFYIYMYIYIYIYI